MTEAEITEYVSGLPGVVTVTASEENAAPAAAWGDTFFFYDPDGSTSENQRLPFARSGPVWTKPDWVTAFCACSVEMMSARLSPRAAILRVENSR